MKGQKTLFSSASDEWETPKLLFDQLNSIYDFTLDPCATAENAKCVKFYTKEDDGLSKDWTGERVFCNPPYSQVGLWVSKALYENALCVLLLPARTDTKWFHDWIYMRLNVSVEFFKGRLKFEGAKASAPFPSMLVTFRPLQCIFNR